MEKLPITEKVEEKNVEKIIDTGKNKEEIDNSPTMPLFHKFGEGLKLTSSTNVRNKGF